MSLRIGIGTNLRIQGGFDWFTYWTQSGLFEFFGATERVNAGRLYNQVPGSTDYMTVTGSGLNAVYATGGVDATYQAADTDYCWWKVNATRSITDGNRLIAYDFARTIVKYDNTSPYVIRWIAILKAGISLTADQINSLHSSFELSVWWSGVLNLNGFIKQNRTTARSVWTAESVYEQELEDYLAALVTPLSVGQSDLLNTMILALKTGLSITNLTDFFDQILIYANETKEAGLRNLVQDAYHATNVHATAFTPLEGFQGDGANDYINTGYNPSGFPGNYKQNDCMFAIYIRNNVLHGVSTPSHGSQSGGTVRVGITPYRSAVPAISARIWTNCVTEFIVNWGSASAGFSMAMRNGANSQYGWRNKTKTAQDLTASSAAVWNGNLYDCAANIGGIAGNFNTHQMAVKLIGKAPSDAEWTAIVDAIEAYMDANGKGVIP